MNPVCFYYVEGKCEETLIKALKEAPAYIREGRVKVFNPIEKVLPNSELMRIPAGAMVVFAFDTDIPQTDFLLINIRNLKKYVRNVTVVLLPQVMNLEDELKRCTDVRNVMELTKSKSASDFKRDFCRLTNCRQVLEAHQIDVQRIWETPVPEGFSVVQGNAGIIKNRSKAARR